MKLTLKSIYGLALTLLLTTFSCNNDDEDTITNDITVEDLTISIDENPTSEQSVGSIEATSDETLGFTITSQTPSGALTINENTGELTVADITLFDFETNPMITATISVSNSAKTETVEATINLNDINELSIQDFTLAIDENPTNGDVLGTLEANGDGTLGFSITSQSPTGALSLDENTGELTVADATLFDFETNPVITADIAVDNSGNTETLVATINLNNVSEISIQDLSVTIDENPTDGQSLGTVQANGDGVLTYSITTQTPAGALNIDANTGELTVIDPNLFDFEVNPVITATISVDNSGNSASATATINLNDVDEVSATNTDLTIDENPSNGDVVGTLEASGSNLTYTITFQNPAGAFAIDQNTGELSVADETLFDFETNPNMLATISVSNGVQTVSANAFVELNDVNEIGEYKYGGVIFWIDPTSNNSAGLVCALSDQGTNVPWGCQGTLIAGTSDSIGSGASNTAAILTGCTTAGIAAEIAGNATIEGFTDWFLPSRGELNQMYLQKDIINTTAVANGGAAFIDVDLSNRYWCSSESNNNTAWCILFANGLEQGVNKGASAFSNVRVVRAWTDF